MFKRMADRFFRAVALFTAGTSLAHAHHVMGYALPATALDGLLSGLGHPIIGLDHLLFILGAGAVAAQLHRGFTLPLIFVAASILAAAARAGGAPWEMSELWVAGSLVVLGLVLLAVSVPGRGLLAALFLASGVCHGYALAASIVGAERTPLIAYFVGLTVIQCVIAIAAWGAAAWLATHHPRLPLQRAAGTVVGAAGLVFVALSAAF